MSLVFFATFAFLAVAFARVTPVSRDSPARSTYTANFYHQVSGGLIFSEVNGYVKVDVLISGLPVQEGPFSYFISHGPVTSPGNCTDDLFDPYGGKFGDQNWKISSVGDLSGRHGELEGSSYHITYTDPFLSLNPENEAYIGRRSVVVKSMNGQTLACANILQVGSDSSRTDKKSENRQMQDVRPARNIQISKRQYNSEAERQYNVQPNSTQDDYDMSSFPYTLARNSTMDDYLSNNKYYADSIRHNHGSIVFDINAKGQSPHTFWIGCSDSRSGESSLATLPGEIFTHRNIANIVSSNDTSLQGAIGFATDTLKVSKIIVCGHTDCGGVKAALSNMTLGPVLDEWISPIKQVRARNSGILNRLRNGAGVRSSKLAQLNVIASINALKKHPSVSKALENGGIEIWGMLYDVGSGRLSEVKIN